MEGGMQDVIINQKKFESTRIFTQALAAQAAANGPVGVSNKQRGEDSEASQQSAPPLRTPDCGLKQKHEQRPTKTNTETSPKISKAPAYPHAAL